MMPLTWATWAARFLLLCRAGGHMVMNNPKPYNLDTPPLLQVYPISGGLYPFPCHNQYGFTARTSVEAGASTLVNFTGGGQHGGGSCQFSISYDEPVDGASWNKSARFKTIYSIIGGCPAIFTDETRNLAPVAMDPNKRQDGKHCGNDTGIDCIRQFMVPIPKFLKNGPATFAWTWFNKLGNKEMYMNCAPINITGDTGDEKQIEDLPDIFIANYPNDPEVPNCITGTHADKVVLNFPNPGKYGLILQNPIEPSKKPSGYCTQIPRASVLPVFEPAPQAAASGGSNSSPAISEETSTSTRTATAMPTTNMPLPDGGNSTTVPRLTATTTPPSPTIPTTLTTAVSQSTSTSLAPPMGPHPVVDKPDDKAVACATHGELVCLSDGIFGLCNWGWAIPQEMVAGTQCKDGKIIRRE